jgi:RecA/RadA recombinase
MEHNLEIKISDIKQLLQDGYDVSVETIDNKYTKISKYIEKGFLQSYKIVLDNMYEIKVSHAHLFFTNAGWIESKNLIQLKHKILCNDNEYHSITSIENIGLQEIVDITVEHPEHCYFGNGMLNHNSGKSLLAAYAIRNTQAKDGIGVYFDTESAIDFRFMEAIGVDIKKMIYININSLEQIYQIIEDLLIDLNAQGNKKIVTIVIDSLSATVDATEQEEGYEKAGWNTKKAIVNSKAMRKITNLITRSRALLIGCQQYRIKMGVSFGDDKCVDPYSTIIKIKYKENDTEIIENISFADFSKKFLNNEDFTTPEVFDLSHLDIEIETLDGFKNKVFKPMNLFVVKESVDYYYTDENLKGSENHQIVEDLELIHLKDHKDFYKVDLPLQIVDCEVEELHTYLANGRFNHNTTSGGLAWQYYSSVRVKLAAKSKIKAKINDIESIVGVETEATIKKTRMGPGGRTASFQILYDRGIVDYDAWVDKLEQYGLIEGKTSMFYYDTELKDKNGEPVEYKFRKKGFEDLITKEHPHLKEQIYKLLCEKMVMKYKTEDIDESDLSYEKNYEEGNDSEIVDETNDKDLQVNTDFENE